MQLRRTLSCIRALAGAERGTSMLEFALGLPVVLALGGWGAELSNYAIINMLVKQSAMCLADNASRVGSNNNGNLAVFQLREVDINDVLQGARLTGTGINLTKYGRITVSSLENIQQSYDTTTVQRIHWQRCIGQESGSTYDSSYGTTSTTAGSDPTQANAGTAMPGGMGDTPTQVNAPANTGVIFVEVNYLYQPLFGTMFMAQTKIHYTASFIVRDNRDFTQIYNPSPTSTASTCNLHNA